MSFRVIDVNVTVADKIEQLADLADRVRPARALECKTGGSWICVGPTTNLTCVGASVRLSKKSFNTRLSLDEKRIASLRDEINDLVQKYAKRG